MMCKLLTISLYLDRTHLALIVLYNCGDKLADVPFLRFEHNKGREKQKRCPLFWSRGKHIYTSRTCTSILCQRRMFTCHLHTSSPLVSSLHAAKSRSPTLSSLHLSSVSPARNTDPSFPIATPLILSPPAVPLYQT